MVTFEENNEVVKTIGSKEEPNLEEEKAQEIAEESERQARMYVLKKYWTLFSQVYDKLNNGMTLEEIQEEVLQKKSNLTARARQFVLTQEKYIRLWVQDLKEEQEAKKNG